MQKGLILPVAIIGILIVAILIVIPVVAQGGWQNNKTTNETKQIQGTAIIAETTKLNTDQTNQLLYMIEEEKLAHDVYSKMYEIWGIKKFNNIAKSETNHQDQMLNLLNAYEIKDPRLGIEGIFVNQDLQALYNKLVSSGTSSLQYAYDAGILIEKTDINDLDTAKSYFTQNDILNTLNKLQKASENHLKAFSSAKT